MVEENKLLTIGILVERGRSVTPLDIVEFNTLDTYYYYYL